MPAKNKIHIVIAETDGGDLELKYLGRMGGDAVRAYDALSISQFKRRLLFQGIHATRVQECRKPDHQTAADAKPNPKTVKKN